MTTPAAVVLGTLAFAAELAAWVALARWGWAAGGSALTRVLLAVAAPLAFIALWGRYLSPKATVPLGADVSDVLRALVFLVAALAAWRVWGAWPAAALLAVAWGTLIAARLTPGL